MWNMHVYIVGTMPLHMWEGGDAPAKYGVKDVLRNVWTAGPYVTRDEAVEAMDCIVCFEDKEVCNE